MLGKLLATLVVATTLAAPAHATPVQISYVNVSGFTLGGVNYPYSGRYAPFGPQYLTDIWILTDTSTYVPYLYTDPFTHITRQLYETTTDVTAVIGYNGQPLAVVTDPLELRGIPTLSYPGEEILDLFNSSTGNTIFLNDGVNQLEFGQSFATNLGTFSLTMGAEEGGRFDLPLDPNFPLPGTVTPEPGTLTLLATGTLGALDVLRRRRSMT